MREFFDWWLTGLLSALPNRIKEKIAPTPDELTINYDGQRFTLRHYDVRQKQLIEEGTFKQDDEIDLVNLERWLTPIRERNMRFILKLDHKKVLRKKLSLPLAAEKNLDEIFSFEMDRQTPFTLEQVYSDRKVVSRDIGNNKLLLELFVVPKSYLDPLLDRMLAWQISPHVVAINTETEGGAINLLPPDRRPRNKRQISALTLAASLGCTVLFFAMLYIPPMQHEKTLLELEAELNRVRVAATQTQALVKEREEIITRAEFLHEKHYIRAAMIALINELSGILPDSTWLSRLAIRQDEIQLQGESDMATAIIQQLENSDLFEKAQFRAPLMKNNATGKDRFQVSANIVLKDAASASD